MMAKFYAAEITLALIHLHEHGIIYRVSIIRVYFISFRCTNILLIGPEAGKYNVGRRRPYKAS